MSWKPKLMTMDRQRGNKIMLDTQLFGPFKTMSSESAGPILHAFVRWELGEDEDAVRRSLRDDLSSGILNSLIDAQKAAVNNAVEKFMTNRCNRLGPNRNSVDPECENQPSTTVDDRQRPLENDHDPEQPSYVDDDRRQTLTTLLEPNQGKERKVK